VRRPRPNRVLVNVYAVQNRRRRKHLLLDMMQQIPHGAADLEHGLHVLTRIDSACPQLFRQVAEQKMTRRIDVGRPKPLVDLIRLGVRQMIGPEEPVQPHRVTPVQVVQHPHREFEPARNLAPSRGSHQRLP
jgi:hypothetical protein